MCLLFLIHQLLSVTTRRSHRIPDDLMTSTVPTRKHESFFLFFFFHSSRKSIKQKIPISSSIFQSCCNWGWIKYRLTPPHTHTHKHKIFSKNYHKRGFCDAFLAFPKTLIVERVENTLIFFCFVFVFLFFLSRAEKICFSLSLLKHFFPKTKPLDK